MDFQRIPSLLGNNRVDISVTDTIGHLVGGEAPLGVQFRSDGSVIPLEEIIRFRDPIFYSKVYFNVLLDRSNKMKAKNDHIAKLNCIYQILCCLHNLKMKDLKSQVGSFKSTNCTLVTSMLAYCSICWSLPH